MKKLIALSAISMGLFALNANAALGSKSKVAFKGDVEYAGFCEAVVSDDVALMKKSLRSKVGIVAKTERRVKSKLMSESGVKCNGTNLEAFSKERAAKQVAEFLQK